MVHPFKFYDESKSIESMDQISVTLEMCTVYKGVPHGIAIINYTDPKSEWGPFKGVGVFHHGQLHNAPFSCLDGNGFPCSFSKMHKGRPADASYYTQFWADGYTEHVDSLEERTHVGGW